MSAPHRRCFVIALFLVLRHKLWSNTQNATGILVKNISPNGLATEIIRFLENPDLRLRLSKSARAYAKQFTWEAAGKESWNLIQTITNNSSRQLSKNGK